MTKRGGGRTPLSYAIRAPLLLDLQHRQKLRKYIAARTCTSLGLDYGVRPESIRLAGTRVRKGRRLTNEQREEVVIKRREYQLAKEEMKRYRLEALAQHYGISKFTVIRLQRTLWGEPYKIGR